MLPAVFKAVVGSIRSRVGSIPIHLRHFCEARINIPLRVVNSREWDYKLLLQGCLDAHKREFSIVSSIERNHRQDADFYKRLSEYDPGLKMSSIELLKPLGLLTLLLRSIITSLFPVIARGLSE